MVRPLGWVAIGGLGVGVVCLSLAWVTGGSELRRKLELDYAFGSSCSQDGATAAERRFAWTGGDAINIALAATVHYRAGEGDEVIVRGPPDLVANVNVSGGRIRLDCRGFRSRSVDVTLPGRVFRKIGIAGSGKLFMENVNQPDLELSIAGSGVLNAQGSVEHVTVSIAGSGDAKLANLAAKHLTVKVSGSGNVEAAPKDLADIKISGSGDVKLVTRPAQLRSHIAGSGRIIQPPTEAADGKK